MISSYLKTALRSLRKNKALSAINIIGLSIGMAVSLSIGLWIWDEITFDKAHANHDRIAQIIQNVTNNGEVQTWFSVPAPLAEELRTHYGSDFEQIINTQTGRYLLTTPTRKFMKEGIAAEAAFVDMFSVDLLAGNPKALTDPSSILLSASAAKVYFDDMDPIGQVMKLGEGTMKVAGVYRDFPANSSFAGNEFIAPWEIVSNLDWFKTMTDPWRPNAFIVYVKLNPNANFETASSKIRDAKLRKVNEQLAKKKPALFLFPMNRWHLYSEFHNGANTGGRIQYVWMFGIIGSFVLLMACINFMNLTTAKSEQRAKEVGIRKSIGSLRSQLIVQFFCESALITFFSWIVGLLLLRVALPYFNQIADKQMELPWNVPLFWVVGITFSLLTGFVAGSYPALYLSAIQPVKALKGTYRAGSSASLPRKVLVVLQFAISVVLIVGSVTVFHQIRYAQERPIGYNRSSLVSIPMVGEGIHKHFDAVKDELEKAGAIVNMAEAGNMPTEGGSSSSGFDWDGKDPNLSIDFSTFESSYDYGKTVNWHVVEGRDFSKDVLSDSTALILNESAVHYMGLNDPVGATVRWFQDPMHVIGVVKDIVFNSPYEPVRPTVYGLSRWKGGYLVLRLHPDQSAAASLGEIEKRFKEYNPEEPFSYQFADEEYGKKFGNETRIGKLASIFTVLAILISCLGIFGLSSFEAEQRTKEIGVRKVLGASVFDLWRMLSNRFAQLVMIACIVATPVAYYAMESWLSNYNYRTAFPWWTLVAASAATLLITLLTVSFHTFHAASMKPVKSLRSE